MRRKNLGTTAMLRRVGAALGCVSVAEAKKFLDAFNAMMRPDGPFILMYGEGLFIESGWGKTFYRSKHPIRYYRGK